MSAGTAGPDGVDVSVTVRNEGSRAGTETVEVYVKAERPGTPNAQLKGLAKVSLQPGEEQRVTVHLPLAALALCDEAGVSQFSRVITPCGWAAASRTPVASLWTGQAPARLALHQTEKVVMDE